MDYKNRFEKFAKRTLGAFGALAASALVYFSPITSSAQTNSSIETRKHPLIDHQFEYFGRTAKLLNVEQLGKNFFYNYDVNDDGIADLSIKELNFSERSDLIKGEELSERAQVLVGGYYDDDTYSRSDKIWMNLPAVETNMATSVVSAPVQMKVAKQKPLRISKPDAPKKSMHKIIYDSNKNSSNSDLGVGVGLAFGNGNSIASLNGFLANDKYPVIAAGILVDDKSNIGADLGLAGKLGVYDLGWDASVGTIDGLMGVGFGINKEYDVKKIDTQIKPGIGVFDLFGSDKYESLFGGYASLELSKRFLKNRDLAAIVRGSVNSEGNFVVGFALNYGAGNNTEIFSGPSIADAFATAQEKSEPSVKPPVELPVEPPIEPPIESPVEPPVVNPPYVPPVNPPVDEGGYNPGTGNSVGN